MPLRVLAGSRRGGSGVRSPGRDDAVPALASRRRAFQITLGVIWLLDAALQFQPYMFTRAFVRDVILPAASGNPAIVGLPIIWSGDLMLRHIVIINAAFATAAVAARRRPVLAPGGAPALAASIAWSLAVWWLGEGLGGVLTGALDPFGGAPGAVLLYVVLALLVWPPAELQASRGAVARGRPSVAESGLLSGQAARALWVVLWAGLGCAALLPATRSADALSGTLSGLRDGEPGWIRAFDTALSNALAGHGAPGRRRLRGALLRRGGDRRGWPARQAGGHRGDRGRGRHLGRAGLRRAPDRSGDRPELGAAADRDRGRVLAGRRARSP